MNKELQKKLTKYSAAAAAVVATGAAADAQIVYTSVNKTINQGGVDSVDINQDGTYDLAMIQYNVPSYQYDIVLGAPLNSQGHAIAGSAPSGYNYPFRLNAGDQINTQQFLAPDSGGTFAWVYAGTSNPWGSFWNGGVTDGFLGVKLNVSGSTHYGWIRMDVSADGKTITIKDMAYNAAANDPIQANQSMGLPHLEEIANSVVMAGSMLKAEINIEFTEGTLNLMDISGKVVETFELNAGSQEFDLSHLASGTYVVSMLVDGNTINKKIII